MFNKLFTKKKSTVVRRVQVYSYYPWGNFPAKSQLLHRIL
jgi:hypothetical protein